jgi:hypothetical protein
LHIDIKIQQMWLGLSKCEYLQPVIAFRFLQAWTKSIPCKLDDLAVSGVALSPSSCIVGRHGSCAATLLPYFLIFLFLFFRICPALWIWVLFFVWYWVLNLGPCAHKESTLPLKPQIPNPFVLVIFQVESHAFCPRPVSVHSPPISTFQIPGITGMNHSAWLLASFWDKLSLFAWTDLESWSSYL